MRSLVLVGVGGFIGAAVRYGMSGWISARSSGMPLPISTMTVNTLGCLAAGIIIGLIERHVIDSPSLRLFLLTGTLGGFTTFSAFGTETYFLLQQQRVFWAMINVLGSVCAGLIALWMGLKLST